MPSFFKIIIKFALYLICQTGLSKSELTDCVTPYRSGFLFSLEVSQNGIVHITKSGDWLT